MTTLIPKVDLMNGGTTPTGAVNLPINQKLQQVVHVKDFGAIGDGTTDDTTALTNAINSGYSLDFSNGTYLISGALYPKSNTVWLGKNNGTIKYSIVSCLIDANTIDNWSFNGITIDGNYTAYAPTTLTQYPYGIRLDASTNIEISGSIFKNLWRIGIIVGHLLSTACSNISITNNTIQNIGKSTDPTVGFGNGIAVLNAHDVMIQNNYITAITGNTTATGGITLEPGNSTYDCYNVTISDNTISNITDAPSINLYQNGTFTGNRSNIIINNNSITGTGIAYGISCQQFGDTYIRSNYLKTTQGILVQRYQAYEAIIEGNTILSSSTGGYGIRIQDGIASVAIKRNTLRSIAGVGIQCDMYDYVTATPIKSCLIQDNHLQDVNSHGIAISAGNFVITGNTMVGCCVTNTSGYYITSLAGGASQSVNGYIGSNTMIHTTTGIAAFINAQGDIFNNVTFGDNNFVGSYLTYYTLNTAGRIPGVYTDILPSGGTWVVGDKINKLTPVSGGTIGWVCTTAGTPGTFKTFGVIS
jgi:hypothetical protein